MIYMGQPNVYVFNPTCEMAVLNRSVSYMPPARLRLFESNLSGMLLWLASGDDIVVADNTSMRSLKPVFEQLGIGLPHLFTLPELEKSNLPLGQLRAWGWSPEIYHRFRTLKSKFQLPLGEWLPHHRLFFSRFTNQRLIDALMPLIVQSYGVDITAKPIEAATLDEVNSAIDHFGGRAVVKSPWSSSGRGIAIVDKPNARIVDERWLLGALKQQGTLLIEPYLQKLHDLSFHFWLHPHGAIDYLGHNFFTTDNGGQFTGCYLHGFPAEDVIGLPITHLKAMLTEGGDVLRQALLSLGLSQLYSGPIGVDAIVYKAENGAVMLHPAIEINLRYTMGFVNLQMRKRLGGDIKGRWGIAQFDVGEWARFCETQTLQNPLVVEDGKAVKGFLPLLPSDNLFGAWMVIVP
jgi:hypothetical protein